MHGGEIHVATDNGSSHSGRQAGATNMNQQQTNAEKTQVAITTQNTINHTIKNKVNPHPPHPPTPKHTRSKS